MVITCNGEDERGGGERGAVQGLEVGGGWAVQGEQHMQRLGGRRSLNMVGRGVGWESGEEVGETAGTGGLCPL